MSNRIIDLTLSSGIVGTESIPGTEQVAIEETTPKNKRYTWNMVLDWIKSKTLNGNFASTWGTITGTLANQVDLSNALAAKADLVDGVIPASQLPSYVDDVLEYSSQSSFPTTGTSGKIYVALDTNKTYRWSGSAYVEISQSLALGETSSTAYRGDRGKVAYDYSQVGHLPLAGGTMSNTNLVNNLNADLLDGRQGSYYAVASVYPSSGLTAGYLPYKSATVLANSPIYTNGTNIGLGTTDIEAWDSSFRTIETPYTSLMMGIASKALHLNSNAYFDGAWKYKSTSAASSIYLSDSGFIVRTANTGTIDETITWTNAFSVGMYGNAAIGSTTESNITLKLTQGTKPYGIYSSVSTTNQASNWGYYSLISQISSASNTCYSAGAMYVIDPIVYTGYTNSGYAKGVYAEVLRNNISATSDSGMLTTIYGTQIIYGHSNTNATETPLTTTACGLYISPHRRTGIITNMYDIYLASESTGGTVTNGYGIYQANTKLNYLKGALTAEGNLSTRGECKLLDSSGSTKWSVKLNASTFEMEFYNASGVKKAWIDQNGNLSAVGEVTAYA